MLSSTPRSKSYYFSLHHFSRVAQNTLEIGIDTTPGDFKFIAGQYIRINLNSIKSNNIKDTFREFSISSAPQNNILTSTFRISDSEFKQKLIKLELGTKLHVEGPFGVFTLPDNANQPIVMVAGGIGITPFMSMLRDSRYKNHDISVLYFNKSIHTTAYKNELEQLATRPKRKVDFFYEPLSTEALNNSPQSALYYIAGKATIVTTVRKALEDSNVISTNIFTEEFTGY